MELWLIFKVLLRRWYLVLIPTVIVAIVTVPDIIDNEPSGAGGFSTVIRYTAAQQLDAIPNRDGDYQDVWLASELTVNALTEWVRTNRFAEAVAEQAAEQGVEIDSAALVIAADNERSIGQIFINWPDADELRTIAAMTVIVLEVRSQDAFPQLGGEPAQVEALDDPVVNPVPPTLPNRLRPLIQLALGVIAGVGLAFLVEYLDPTLRERNELERTGLTVVGTIPRR
jgi:capsular polysaccharide biosynthesis protein